MAKAKVDPADMGNVQEEIKLEDKEQELSFKRLKMTDLKAIPKRAARIPAPFEGYPEKTMVVQEMQENSKGEHKMVELTINATHAVLMSPTERFMQDPSGENVLIKDPKSKKLAERTSTIVTTYNRVVSYGGRSFNAVFDRRLLVDDGEVNYCIVRDPICRAQLIYFYDAKAGRIDIDTRFLLLDDGQIGRLRQVFQMAINPRLKLEKSIADTFDSGLDTTKMESLPGIPGDQE